MVCRFDYLLNFIDDSCLENGLFCVLGSKLYLFLKINDKNGCYFLN